MPGHNAGGPFLCQALCLSLWDYGKVREFLGTLKSPGMEWVLEGVSSYLTASMETFHYFYNVMTIRVLYHTYQTISDLPPSKQKLYVDSCFLTLSQLPI